MSDISLILQLLPLVDSMVLGLQARGAETRVKETHLKQHRILRSRTLGHLNILDVLPRKRYILQSDMEGNHVHANSSPSNKAGVRRELAREVGLCSRRP